MLKDKVAVIDGAGGAIGGAVERAFACEGAKLFLTGHRRATVEAVANEFVSGGGSGETAKVDALDEQAVDKHLQSLIDMAGPVNISLNAVGTPGAKILRYASGRAACRAVLPADHDLCDVVLPDCAHGGPADDRE